MAKRDRLARDVIVGAMLERLAERLGAQVVAADGVGNGDGPEHQLMRRLVDALAEFERAVIGARTKAALAVLKAKGMRTGGIPYGYRLAEDGQMLEPDPQEQQIVKIVRKLRSAGKSLRFIAETLTRQGFETRTRGYWHVQTVSNISRE